MIFFWFYSRFFDQLWSSFGVLRFVLDEHYDVSKERTTHMWLHVNRKCKLTLEAIFVPVILQLSFITRSGKPKETTKRKTFVSGTGPQVW